MQLAKTVAWLAEQLPWTVRGSRAILAFNPFDAKTDSDDDLRAAFQLVWRKPAVAVGTRTFNLWEFDRSSLKLTRKVQETYRLVWGGTLAADAPDIKLASALNAVNRLTLGQDSWYVVPVGVDPNDNDNFDWTP